MLKRPYVMALLKEAAGYYGIEGYDSILKRKNAFVVEDVYVTKNSKKLKKNRENILVSDELLTSIDEKLPQQPWPVGIHVAVAKELNISVDIVSGAIRKLIRLGRRYHQKDGIVYDSNNNIIIYDNQRVTSKQIESFKEGKKC